MFLTLSQMVADAPISVGAIYVAPIKALLNNQAERLGLYVAASATALCCLEHDASKLLEVWARGSNAARS